MLAPLGHDSLDQPPGSNYQLFLFSVANEKKHRCWHGSLRLGTLCCTDKLPTEWTIAVSETQQAQGFHVSDHAGTQGVCGPSETSTE